MPKEKIDYMNSLFKGIKNRVIDVFTPLYIAAFIACAVFAAWVTNIIYEPHLSDVLQVPQYAIYITILIPTASLSFLILALISLIADAIRHKGGAGYRLQVTLLFLLLILLPTVIITYFSSRLLKVNTNLLIKEDISESLEESLKALRKDYEGKKSSMLYSLRRGDETTNLSPLFANRGDRREEKEEILSYLQNTYGIREAYVFNSAWGRIIPEKDSYPKIFDGFLSKYKNASSTNDIVVHYTEGREHIFVATRRVIKKDSLLGYLIWTAPVDEAFLSRKDGIISSLRSYNSIKTLKGQFELIIDVMFVVISSLVALLVIFFSFIFSHTITSPIESLAEGTKKVAEDNLDFTIEPRGSGEVKDLIERFNTMVRDIKQHRALRARSERVEAWREVALRLAHEIKNPLTPISLNAEMIGRIIKNNEMDEEDIERALKAVGIIDSQCKNILSLLNDFSQFSFTTELSDKALSVNKMLEETFEAFNTSATNIKMRLSLSHRDFYMRMDRNKLVMAFGNLLKNAHEAIEENGSIILTSRFKRDSFGEAFLITVEDTGGGISDEKMMSIFEPYFTTKPKGSGLGLSVVEKIISDHEGYIYLDSKVGEGTIFFVEFRS